MGRQLPCSEELCCNFPGNGLRVKIQGAKTSEDFSEERYLLRGFQRYPEILENPVKLIFLLRNLLTYLLSSANVFFFREVFRSFLPFAFYPLALFSFQEQSCRVASMMSTALALPPLLSTPWVWRRTALVHWGTSSRDAASQPHTCADSSHERRRRLISKIHANLVIMRVSRF